MQIFKSKQFITAYVVLLILASLSSVFVYSCYLAIRTNISVELDTATSYQTLEGFGASSAWTYQDLGAIEDTATQKEIIEMLYGNSGMRLNIFRYNVGAGSIEIKDSLAYSDTGRMSESFFDSSKYINDESFRNPDNYDFTRDSAVMSLLTNALSLGNIEKIVLFANSPHYLMTESRKTHGDYEYQNNLPAESYGAFSDYLLVITDYIYSNVVSVYNPDIEVYISPINEPQWKWGGEYASQEGCHMDPAELAAFYQVFYERLNAYNETNGTNYHMDAFECGNYTLKDSRDYYEAFEGYEWFEALPIISMHSYSANDSKYVKNRFASYMDRNYPGYGYAVTEYCEMEWGRDTSIDSGLLTARVIIRDLTILSATEWSWWLSVSSGDYNDGLVYWDYNETSGESAISVLKRYYTMAHFSRYLNSGDKRIEVKDSDFLGISNVDFAAFIKPDGTTVLIMVNSAKSERNITLKGDYTLMTTVTTSTDLNLEEQTSGYNGNITLPSQSIVTILLQ